MEGKKRETQHGLTMVIKDYPDKHMAEREKRPIILCTMNAKTKAKLKRDLRIREALEIQRHNCGPGQGMNEDWGSYVKTTQWGPVFSGM